MCVVAVLQIEPLPSGLRSNSYNHRFPTPQLTNFDYSKGKGGMAVPSHTSVICSTYIVQCTHV
jgi:hypothetical protein